MHVPSGPTLTQQGRKRDVVACLPRSALFRKALPFMKGKRASTVVVVALCRSVRSRSIISQRWSPFWAVVVRQQVTVKLFEGLKVRAVPSVGIGKILTSNPFGGMRE
jgi:hypothetical protein